MTTYNPFPHVRQTKPRSTTSTSDLRVHDLGNGNFLDFKSTPVRVTGAAKTSVLPYQEYHGALENHPKPDEPRTRRHTAPILPSFQYGPSSWPEVPTVHNDMYSDDSCPPDTSSDDVPSQNGAGSISSATTSPLHIFDVNPSFNYMTYHPTQLFDKNHARSVQGPIGFIPWQVHRVPVNFEPHVYLSSPPFIYSFLYHPEILYRIGFTGLYDYATRPPTFQMNIICPLLPWSICLDRVHYITVYDVLSTIFELLREPPTDSEALILYSSSGSKRKYRKIMATYRRRSTRGNTYQQPGDYFRKIDWLCGKHVFDGLVRKEDFLFNMGLEIEIYPTECV